jgi:D-3-phosphoglycerate dehydrogenase
VLRIGDMSGEDIARANKLRIIARNGTGVDSIDLEECKRRGVVVTNCPGGNAAVRERLGASVAQPSPSRSRS